MEGTVLHSEVLTHRGSDGTTWSPLVVYNYTYGGVEHQGLHQTLGSSGDYDGARRLVDAHPPGRKVEVKVNPAHPSESRLRLDFIAENYDSLLMMAIGSVLLAPGVLILKYGRGPRPSAGEPDIPLPPSLPEVGTSYAVVECRSCHQLVEPRRKWGGRVKCPRCGGESGVGSPEAKF